MKNEVLVIGSPIYSYAGSVSKAFNLNGIKSDFKIYKIPNKYIKNIPLISKAYYYWYYNIYPESFYKYCLDNAPEDGLLVLFGINYLTNKQLLKIKETKKLKILIWFIDSIYTFPKFYNNIEVSDYILCYNKSESDILRQSGKNAVFCPMAYDHTYYFPIKDTVKEYDLYFVGALGRRLDFFETLLSRLEHLNLNIRIDGPMSFVKRMRLRRKYPLLYKYSTGRPANHVMINECYNKSKICLGIMPRQADSGFSTRTYEICGSGALQLTDGNKEVLESLFTIDREILHFNNMEELVGMIDQIIRHYESGTYKSIADAGHLKARQYHTFETRIRQVLGILKE